MADTRSLFSRSGVPLSTGKAATRAQNPRGVPGVYQSGTETNEPGPHQSPTRGLTLVQTTKPGQGVNTDPNRAGSGGTITRGGVLTRVAPTPAKVASARVSYGDFLSQNPNSPAATGSLAKPPAAVPAAPRNMAPSQAAQQFLKDGIAPAQPELSATPAAPVAAPTTRAAQQTESADPLTGDTNSSAGGTTQAIDPALAMGYSRRGSMVPRGQDSLPGQVSRNVGDSMASTFNNLRSGTKTSSLSRRQFADRRAQSPYSSGVRSLFVGLGV